MVGDLIAIGVVALAATWLGWRAWRKLRGRGGCGCDTSTCPATRSRR